MTDEDFEKGNTTLETIIYDLINNYESLSNNCLNYYKSNHAIESVAAKFLNLCAENGYSINEIPDQCKRHSLSRRVYLWYLKYLIV